MKNEKVIIVNAKDWHNHEREIAERDKRIQELESKLSAAEAKAKEKSSDNMHTISVEAFVGDAMCGGYNHLIDDVIGSIAMQVRVPRNGSIGIEGSFRSEIFSMVNDALKEIKARLLKYVRDHERRATDTLKDVIRHEIDRRINIVEQVKSYNKKHLIKIHINDVDGTPLT